MTLDRAVALIAVHVGVIDEEKIDNMSYLFFEEVLEELGHKLNYDAVVNYAGNSFAKDSWDMIQESNPMLMGDGKQMSRKKQQEMASFFGAARVLPSGSPDIPRAPGKGKE